MNNDKNLSIIQKEICDPNSALYLDNLLDLAASVLYDIHCSGTWKNSKPIKAFLDRFSNFSEHIYKLRVSLNDFNLIKTVGQGGFGRVDLVRHKKTNNIYAMKVMDKSTFVQNSFNGFWEERDIMAKNSSDWLVKCFYTFMDLKKLYIVMEYMPGGDLYHWMTELEDFSDEQTHFYAVEMVLAMEVLHNMGFIHRDLKPDNMLLDKNGHMKLADFGTCIKVNNGKVKTNFQVGTPDYISPEVLRNTGIHDLEVGFEIDWWAFGIVIYELFYGETPFEGESTSTLYQNIMCYKKTLIYPDDKPGKPEFIDFLSKILTEPTERMGIAEVKKHPYFTKSEHKWNFENIREFPSPVIFQVNAEDDTNFITYDPSDKRNNVNFALSNHNFFSGENMAFTGFTFNRFEKYSMSVDDTLLETSAGFKKHVPIQSNMMELEVRLSEIELAKQQLSVKLDNTLKDLAKTQLSLVNVEKELVDKEALINAKKTEYISISDANKQLKSKIELQIKQNEMTQREMEQLKSGLLEKDNMIRGLKSENCNLSDEISNIQANLQTKEEKLDKLMGELEEKTGQIDNFQKIDYLLEEERAHSQILLSEIAAKNRKINEYELQLEAMSNNTVNETSKSKVVLERMDTVGNNAEDLERFLKEKQKFDVRLSHMTNDLNHMEQMKNAALSDLSTEKQKRQEIEKMRDKLSNDLASQKMIVASLQNRLNAAEDQKRVLKQRINVIESEKDQIEQEKKMFESMAEVRTAENEGIVAEMEEAEEMFTKREQEFENEKLNLQVQFNLLIKELENAKLDSEHKSAKLDELKFVILENENLSQIIDKFKLELEEKKQHIIDCAKINMDQKIELEKNEKQMANDKAKIMSLVTKIDEMIKNPKAMMRIGTQKNKKDNESIRKIKQLESELLKEKLKFQEKVLECNELRNDCQHLQNLNKDLRTELETKVNTIKDLMVNLNNAVMHKSGSDDDSTGKVTEWKSLEGKVEVLKKSKGRHKINWVPSFAVLKPFKLDIFQNETDHVPTLSIDLRAVMHIREPSAAECVHIDKTLLPKVLQVIYEKQETVDETRRTSTVSNDNSRRIKSTATMSSSGNVDDSLLSTGAGPNSSLRSTSTVDAVSPLTVVAPSASLSQNNGIYNIENHSFVPMRFRSVTNCDICHQICSDFINPPMALECANCKKRIHMDHVYNNDYKIQWCQGAIEMLLFKVDNKDAKFAWLNCLNKLKESQKTNEVQVAPNTFYRSVRHPMVASPPNLNAP